MLMPSLAQHPPTRRAPISKKSGIAPRNWGGERLGDPGRPAEGFANNGSLRGKRPLLRSSMVRPRPVQAVRAGRDDPEPFPHASTSGNSGGHANDSEGSQIETTIGRSIAARIRRSRGVIDSGGCVSKIKPIHTRVGQSPRLPLITIVRGSQRPEDEPSGADGLAGEGDGPMVEGLEVAEPTEAVEGRTVGAEGVRQPGRRPRPRRRGGEFRRPRRADRATRGRGGLDGGPGPGR